MDSTQGNTTFRNRTFYALRPFIPRRMQLVLRRILANNIRRKYSDVWPIDPKASSAPEGWGGWPHGKKFALVLVHDVDTWQGAVNCVSLMKLETSLGLRSTFNVVPQRYPIPEGLLSTIREEGFGIGVHGLTHDGKLFQSLDTFKQRAVRINEYLRQWRTRGFSSPSMHHNLDWMYLLDIDYATSTFDTDPFEPQPEGIGSIFPQVVENSGNGHRYVELPYTLPQDSTLFVILKEQDISIWKKKVDWIAQNGGMALINTHPDYMHFDSGRSHDSQYYAVDKYIDFIKYVNKKHGDSIWHATSAEVAEWTINTSQHIRKTADIFSRNRLDGKDMPKIETLPSMPSANRQRPRACMVAYTFYEGDNRVRRYGETLAAEGWDVDAFVLRSPDRPRAYTLRGVNIYGIQDRTHNEKRALTYLNRLTKFLLRSGLRLAKHHIRQPYKLVHVHSIPDFEVIAGLVPKIRGAKIILDVHDIVPELFLNKFGKSKDSLLFKLLVIAERVSCVFADHVIIANHIWHKRIVERSVPLSKCSVVMNFPDSNIFSPRARTRNKDGEFHMLYPGTLSRHQGIDTAIEAVSMLREITPNLRFHIYGSGTDEELLRDMTARLDLQDRVIFHPPVSIEEIADVMVNAELGVEPKIRNSFSDEAFSTKILEFMMLGVPIAASDTTVHKYYIPDDSVRYFKAGDAEDLAVAIREMYENEQLRRQCIQKGHEVVQDFVWERKKSVYLDIVTNLTRVAFRPQDPIRQDDPLRQLSK